MKEPSYSQEEGKDLQEKMKKIDISPTVSPTCVLMRNTVLLPSGVVRVKQSENIKGGTDSAATASTSSSGSATGNPRNKTALAPGHSLMDWIRLGSSGIDLTGVGGVSQLVTPAELAKHNKQNDAWIAIRGVVFNVSRYMDFHPGGVSELMKGVGRDATKLFDDVHAWVNYQSILQKCTVGRLIRTPSFNPDKAISNLSNPSIPSSLLSSCKGRDAEKEPESFLSNLQFKWKQTTGTITFTYLTSPNFTAVSYRLTKLSEINYCLEVVLDKNTITHELELTAEVKWPPNWRRNCEDMVTDFVFDKVTRKVWKSYGSHTESYGPTRTHRMYYEYEVVSNVSLCPIVHLLLLACKNYMEIAPVGRHVEAKMTVMGMDVSRMYTPVPPCLHPDDMIPDYKPNCICLMVKRYSDGALSPSMTALEPGQTLTLSNSLGTFIVESFDTYTTIHMLAAGTGLTAMLGIIQRALGRRSVSGLNLICFNTDENCIFYSSQLDRIRDSEKFTVKHVLSQPSDSWKGTRGTVSNELLKELLGPRTEQSCILSCGPKGFLEAARKSLLNLGWKTTQMHEFDD